MMVLHHSDQAYLGTKKMLVKFRERFQYLKDHQLAIEIMELLQMTGRKRLQSQKCHLRI